MGGKNFKLFGNKLSRKQIWLKFKWPNNLEMLELTLINLLEDCTISLSYSLPISEKMKFAAMLFGEIIFRRTAFFRFCTHLNITSMQ